ncbi:MAG: carbamoyltransferase HypF [Rhodocyclaceae bacterium]|nr:carbamoyltransferase HypF [Rhodocyclaceae bacterium]
MAGLDSEGRGRGARMISAQRIRVTGVVQGVGFRPFVWRLARDLRLSGWVRNDAGGVDILAEGDAADLGCLGQRLRREAPPLARIDGIAVVDVAAAGLRDFVIAASGGGKVATAIGHDTGVCGECLAELFDAGNRRWRHAFITCTHCGPRYTVTRRLPYDRPQTSLAPFPLCPECAREYAAPADRRFHAETTCCPHCGPHLELLDADGAPVAGDAIAAALALLNAGAIVAVKGLGGFHLACDARQPAAVARLRLRKAREEKPFAVMAANVASAAALVDIDGAERERLASSERPIVLLQKRAGADAALPGIAPGLAWLGVVLPYTPIQWLLFHEAAGRPQGTAWLDQPQDLLLVMTSANPGGEPLVIDNVEARQRLAGIADAFLRHDREIVVRCDDSVVRSAAGGFQAIRRARAFTPRAIRLTRAGPGVLALGGWYKNTVCVTRGLEAFVSQHIGDLDNAATCGFLEEAVAHLLQILDVEPAVVAHDLHPDFHSTRLAARIAAARDIPLIGVQHHHAHIAAVLAEHRAEEAALGLALDGVGLGTDGGAWGGELLRVDGAACRRLGHLPLLPLPGGDRAAREPWRMAAAALHLLGRGEEIATRFADQPGAATIAKMLAQRVNCPPTSSAGRWFDAAAGLLGVRPVMAFEGQAAMLLEGLASAHGAAAPLPGPSCVGGDGTPDLLPLLAAMADAADVGAAAAQFHATLARLLAQWVIEAAEREMIRTVALGGGCFLNRILAADLREKLQHAGLTVLEAREVPPNDGGLALGQAWIAQRSI